MVLRYLSAVLLLALLGMAGLAQGKNHPPIPSPVVAANNTFGFKLYAQLLKTDAQKNLFISPVSLEYALAMPANGARGKTLTQMAQTLGWGTMTREQVNSGFQALTANLCSVDPQVEISLANSLWLNKENVFYDAFLNVNKQYFGATVRAVDFTSPQTVTTMNDWVKAQTHGMIPTLAKPGDFSDDTRLALLNALYFKGSWTTPFDTKLTGVRPFTAAGGTVQQVMMMQRTGLFDYYADEHLQIVRLPYGKGEMNMLILLPCNGEDLAALAGRVFTTRNWSHYLEQLHTREVSLSLPRFKAGYEVELKAPLQELGMSAAFNSLEAEFPDICVGHNPCIDLVRQKTALEVSEEGTKAAAATEVVLSDCLPMSMQVNRPFLFAIQHENGALLFLGSIVNPE